MTTCASLSFLLNTTLFGSRLMMIDGSGAEDKMMSTLWSNI